MNRICILTRGSHDYGMGHLHRSLWLREALLGCGRELRVEICCLPGAEAEDYYRGRSATVHWADWLAEPNSLPTCELLIVDWLDSPPGLLEQLRAQAPRILLLDDYGPACAEADMVVQSLLSEIAPAHGRIGRAEVYSGITYLQLAPTIMRLRYGAQASLKAIETELVTATERQPGPVHCVMLSFGGTPRRSMAETVLEILREVDYEGRVIVKPADPDTVVPAGLDVELHPDASQFHELLSACDACIIGGGLTLYEAIFLGVPPMVLPVVEHQMQTALKLEAAGCCMLGGQPGTIDRKQLAGRLLELLGGPSHRGRLIHNGMRLVDGRGIYRTLDLLLELLDRPVDSVEPG